MRVYTHPEQEGTAETLRLCPFRLWLPSHTGATNALRKEEAEWANHPPTTTFTLWGGVWFQASVSSSANKVVGGSYLDRPFKG